ncbi:hypothetical protein SAMN04487850_1570 [Prevotella aff. ruminicola Tc2-24]|jgi:hypothetical protein|uniref:Lipoprotein n=1 Tax=Prevotella aff. ruminicola Tc2-24 TaxID=81582 RepID=A0A1I0P499_9BACT|nr:hypothetical protein [Prevotella aff. ruminicola Tc2-24]SEW08875.1 hypothetical protein SAMN04487850_1570 [Prevotella aff. ruminicola Tc2-24]
MQKVYISLFIVLLFSSCTSSDSKDAELEYPIEINNKDLVEAITEYQDFLYKDNKKVVEQGDSVYAVVCSIDINDSIYRYVIYPICQMYEIKYEVPFDLCRVNGHHVVFSHVNSYMVQLEKRFCKLSETVYLRYAKILFPKEYEESRKQESQVLRIYEPDNCYLTFLGDSLIDKTYKQGLSRDKILVKLNGEEVYL